MKTHGQYGTRLYQCWANMKTRCLNPNSSRYADWGGRGIKVCKAWLHFEAFQAWALAHGYTADHVIDRRDNDRGYTPANCRWVTRSVSQYNRRDSRKHRDNKSGAVGVSPTRSGRWQVHYKRRYLGCFDTVAEAADARKQHIEDYYT